jgi:hypothetical protein
MVIAVLRSLRQGDFIPPFLPSFRLDGHWLHAALCDKVAVVLDW